MKNTSICLILLLMFSAYSYSQCGEDLYELALAQTGSDVVLVRDFKVKLREGNKRNPNPVSRFSILMQNGITYRFTVSKDKNLAAEPILLLFDRSQLLGTTENKDQNTSPNRFEYLCNRTGNYQVVLSFRENKGGCAIGMMAMVTDSAFIAQGNKKPVNERFVLYANIETPLHLITDNMDVARKEISISNGKIIFKDSVYYALVPTEGNVNITAKLYNKNDSMVESTNQEFSVIALPAPKISMEGCVGEYITTQLIEINVKLNVTPSLYKIREFYLSTDLGYNTGYRSDNEYFTYDMISFLKSLPSQQRIYIKDIQLISPNGEVINPKPVQYYIR